MNRIHGNMSVSIILVIFISSILVSISFIKIRTQKELQNINTSKTIIYETYKKYATLALDQKREYRIKFDYSLKSIKVFGSDNKLLENIELPELVKYATVYGEAVLDKIDSKITINGNITPIHSIYIFGREDVAKYRISLYGFNILKYLRINIYKNKNDSSPKYNNILHFHKSFNAKSNKLWEKE